MEEGREVMRNVGNLSIQTLLKTPAWFILVWFWHSCCYLAKGLGDNHPTHNPHLYRSTASVSLDCIHYYWQWIVTFQQRPAILALCWCSNWLVVLGDVIAQQMQLTLLINLNKPFDLSHVAYVNVKKRLSEHEVLR